MFPLFFFFFSFPISVLLKKTTTKGAPPGFAATVTTKTNPTPYSGTGVGDSPRFLVSPLTKVLVLGHPAPNRHRGRNPPWPSVLPPFLPMHLTMLRKGPRPRPAMLPPHPHRSSDPASLLPAAQFKAQFDKSTGDGLRTAPASIFNVSAFPCIGPRFRSAEPGRPRRTRGVPNFPDRNPRPACSDHTTPVAADICSLIQTGVELLVNSTSKPTAMPRHGVHSRTSNAVFSPKALVNKNPFSNKNTRPDAVFSLPSPRTMPARNHKPIHTDHRSLPFPAT